MQKADPRVAPFFSQAKTWRAEMQALRAILLDCPVSEEFKWRAPCYTAHGGNVATIWGLKAFCGLSFFKGVLLKDSQGLLLPPGKNSRSVRLARFTDVAGIASVKPHLKAYVLEAIAVEKAGLKVAFAKDDLVYPEELTQALTADPTLKAAFEALTPGRRRGYLLHFSQPKQSKTKVARIETCGPRILIGKGLQDR